MDKDPIRDGLKGNQQLSHEELKFLEEKIGQSAELLKKAKAEIGKEIWGQDKIIDLTLINAVAAGNCFAVGVPGVAKSRLVSRVATVLNLSTKRVQFTPDLMPSDILGSEVQEEDAKGKRFKFIKGPIFTQFLMADEINRATPRMQSALLEAMQERKVTIGGTTYNLQRPFMVMATQNPGDQEGTYPLPEAQLDRFLIKLDVDYPDAEAERKVMVNTTGSSVDIRNEYNRVAAGEDLTVAINKDEQSLLQPVMGKNDLILMQTLARKLPLSDDVLHAALTIVRRARPHTAEAPEYVNQYVTAGPGPRAEQAFALAAKARALMEGRLAPNVGDILALIDPVLHHRVSLSIGANFNSENDRSRAFRDLVPHLTKGLG